MPRTVNGLSGVSELLGVTGGDVSIADPLVSRPYLGVQLRKTKDAAAVSPRYVDASGRPDSILFPASRSPSSCGTRVQALPLKTFTIRAVDYNIVTNSTIEIS